MIVFGQVPGNENPSVLISFASKTLNAGQVTSKLHVIELGAQPGLHIFQLLHDLSLIVIIMVTICCVVKTVSCAVLILSCLDEF